ncbi:hypothetical protein BDQ17DRAFT_1221037, partial [Cyathus striatus]
MDSDEDVSMMDVLAKPAKGKGKASSQSWQDDAAIDDDSLPWVEKYRPVTLDDVVSHKDITGTSMLQWIAFSSHFEKFIQKNRLPHLLFYGPPGTGKTSTILAVARRIYGKD